MKQKNNLILDNEFLQYCELNDIKDIDKLAKETFNRGFTILKYGETPFGKQQIKEVEKIVEVIKEVPVEKIVEVIKEIPAKTKTKVITKEVVVQDNEQIKLLEEENTKLKNELENIKISLDKFNKVKYMKNSNLGSIYDE
jgi:hypothetical protein